MELRTGLPTLEEILALPPAVALSYVVSLDGQLRGPDGSSRSLSGDTDLELLRRLRAASDVVVVGRRTAELEQYGPINVREEFRIVRQASGLRPAPAVVIVDRHGPSIPEIIATHGPRVQLEAGPNLAAVLDPFINRVWLSHAPIMVGNQRATLSITLPPLRERWVADDYVVSRFER